jgi:hypothetical protein
MANYTHNTTSSTPYYRDSQTYSFTPHTSSIHTPSTTNRSFDPSDSSNPDHLLPVNDEKPDMVWNIAKLTITGRFEDDMRLNDYLRIGWEPFNVAHVGYNLCIVYLRRLETI